MAGPDRVRRRRARATVAVVLLPLPLFVPVLAQSLQTSFLTPHFGFALFFLKVAVPPDATLIDIYRGIVPIVVLISTGFGTRPRR